MEQRIKQQQPVAGQVDYQGEPNVSPEEQAMYDEFVDNALQIIYEPKTTDNLLKRLTQSENPSEGLANIAFMIVMTLENSAKQNGSAIPDDVLFHGGIEVLEEIASLAQTEGVHDFTDDEIEAAMFAALDLYGDQKAQSGGLDQEGAKQEFAMLQDADKNGTLDDMIPQLGGGE